MCTEDGEEKDTITAATDAVKDTALVLDAVASKAEVCAAALRCACGTCPR
jgi:hypothetical protein